MQVYKVRIKVLSPLAVTTGEDYYDTDFVVKNGKFICFDQEKFFKKLQDSGKLGLFLQLCQSSSLPNMLRLRKLIYQIVDESDEIYSNLVDSDFESIYKRNVVEYRQENASMIDKINALRVRKIFREAVTKIPFIPGSTVKGAVRTAVLSYLLKKFLEKEPQFIDSIKFAGGVKDQLNKLESLVLCEPKSEFQDVLKKPTSVKDAFRFIKVSDFKAKNFEVRVGVARNVKRGEEKGIPVNLEYLAEESVFEGEITLLPEFGEFFESCLPISREFLLKALRYHYSKVFNEEIRNFGIKLKNASQLQLLKENKNLSLIKLGFHAGRLSKTVFNEKLRKTPSTSWVLNRKPLGWCLLEVI